MSLSAFALVIGVFELLIGLPLLCAPAKTAEWFFRMTKEDLVYRVVGAWLLVLCVLVLAEDMSVSFDLAGLIRLLAWLGAVKCLVICWWPGWHYRLLERFFSTSKVQRGMGVLATAAGVFLLWAGLILR